MREEKNAIIKSTIKNLSRDKWHIKNIITHDYEYVRSLEIDRLLIYAL